MNKQLEQDCPVCGRKYYADWTRLKHGRQTTCSRVCSYKLRAGKMSKSEEFQCGACGNAIRRSPAKMKSRHGLMFCSSACAYSKRKRVVERPYVIVSKCDRKAAAKKGRQTRIANPKPYPDTARNKARAQAIQRIKDGGGVSAYERKAAEVFRMLGFAVQTGVALRRGDGRFACVFDLYIPLRGIFIECHGTYWHGGRWTWDMPTKSQAHNLGYEARKMAIAAAKSLDVRVLWEHEFRRDPVGACLAVAR